MLSMPISHNLFSSKKLLNAWYKGEISLKKWQWEALLPLSFLRYGGHPSPLAILINGERFCPNVHSGKPGRR